MALLAKVNVASPLAVRLKGATVDSAAQQKVSTVPALSVGDDVLVEIVDRKIIIIGKLVAA